MFLTLCKYGRTRRLVPRRTLPPPWAGPGSRSPDERDKKLRCSFKLLAAMVPNVTRLACCRARANRVFTFWLLFRTRFDLLSVVYRRRHRTGHSTRLDSCRLNGQKKKIFPETKKDRFSGTPIVCSLTRARGLRDKRTAVTAGISGSGAAPPRVIGARVRVRTTGSSPDPSDKVCPAGRRRRASDPRTRPSRRGPGDVSPSCSAIRHRRGVTRVRRTCAKYRVHGRGSSVYVHSIYTARVHVMAHTHTHK